MAHCPDPPGVPPFFGLVRVADPNSGYRLCVFLKKSLLCDKK